jgi:predicted nucleotidyltransferase component of viral defense system
MMIGREEVQKKSEELRVHTSHVQRDYIFGWLLSGIYSHSDLGNSLVLKGGNGFRKAYFEKARYSPDLDFATTSSLRDDYLLAQLNTVCDYVSERTEVEFDTDRTRVDPTPSADRTSTIQKARVYFKDFFGEGCEIVLAVRMDVGNLERIILDIQERELIHQYSDATQAAAVVRCLKLEELLASKLKCLLQRRHSVDMYDFVNATIIRPVIDINRSEMVETFLRLTIFRAGPRIVADLLVNLPFQIIKGLWQEFVVAPSDAQVDFDEAVGGFKSIVTDLFGELPVGTSEFAFFPSEFRNPIMQAGQDMTLLRIGYHGVERLAEPYSLKFKQRQDGLAREYLYVYDRTGGRTSGPCLKSLVFSGVDSIENTDIEFEPRYEVELSKAGQLFGDTYFRGSPGLRFGVRTSSSKYVLQCTYCGKRFYRKKYSTKLNKHKDKRGYPCYGRVGVML